MSRRAPFRLRGWLAGALLAVLAACGPAGPPGAPGPADARAPADTAAAVPPAADTAAALACATIFSTNDTHGRLLPTTYAWTEGRMVGGSAVVAAYVHRARDGSGCPVFVVSAGDIMQGTLISNLTDGQSTIAVMNEIGYDVVAIGNHEFDWGIDVLRRRVGQAEFPLLGANIYEKGTDRHPSWTRPYAIVEREGVRIGFIGLTTRSTPTTTRPANVTELEFRSIAAALDLYIPEVRARGVDFVVAVMHAGAFCDDNEICRGEAISELEATTERYDYVVTGHTHSRVETVVHGAPVVQSFANTTAYGLGRLRERPDGSVEAELLGIHQTWADEVTPDARVDRLVDTYLDAVAERVQRVITTLATPLEKHGHEGDYPLGRLIADAQRAAVGTQVALMNNGGIRRGLPGGTITYGDLFELQPFQNTLVRLELPGARLLEALEHALVGGRPDVQVSGLTVRYDLSAPRGGVVEARLADGELVHPDSSYTVTVNDFMATGGSGYDMFLEATSSEITGIVDLDALVAHLADLPNPVEAPTEPRWIPVGR